MLVIDHTSLNCIYIYIYIYISYMCVCVCVFVMSTVIITGSTTLRELDARNNQIGDNGMSLITEGLQSNKMLTKLNVSQCDLSVKGSYCTIQDVFMHLMNGE